MRLMCKRFENRIAVDVMLMSEPGVGMTSGLLYNRLYEHLGYVPRSELGFLSDNCGKLK